MGWKVADTSLMHDTRLQNNGHLMSPGEPTEGGLNQGPFVERNVNLLVMAHKTGLVSVNRDGPSTSDVDSVIDYTTCHAELGPENRVDLV